jgi:hypothetical protein
MGRRGGASAFRKFDDVLPALDAPGCVLLLDARVKCAFVVDPCQMTPSARHCGHRIYETQH